MRYSTRLTLVFLLVLYIGPMIFVSSYSHTTTLAEPNMVKDFSPASEWYEESFHYRKSISINGSSGAGTDYQVMIDITYDSDMQDDFDDLRFTDDGGITELDYWIESYVASTSAVVWVEVSANLDTDQTIYMYYGNAEVSTTNSLVDTFLTGSDFSTIPSTNIGTTYSSWSSVDGWLVPVWYGDIGVWNGPKTDPANEFQFATQTSGIRMRSYVDIYAPSILALGDYTTSVWGSSVLQATARYLDSTASLLGIMQTITNKPSAIIAYETAQDIGTYTGVIGFDIYEAAGNDFFSYVPTLLDSDDFDGDWTFDAFQIEMLKFSNVGVPDRYRYDWFFVAKFIPIEPVVDSFGDEETNIGWNIINSPILLFAVSFDMWGFDTGLIILGLIMIPTSGLYLAYGVKHDRSSDRLFYGLIIFFLGCGLFIGGILP